MKYKGMIFDFNGVLWWDSELQKRAWSEFSKKIRGTGLTDEDMAHHVHGRPNSYTLVYLTGRNLNDAEISKLTDQKESVYQSLCLEQGSNFKLSTGAKDFLNFLKNNKVPFTMATASGLGNVEFFFKHLQLEQWFDIKTLVYDDGKLPGKPAPDIYLKAAKVIGFDPKYCVVVEDAISGITSAHRAGIGMIVALGPNNQHEKLKQINGVNKVISNFEEFDRSIFE